MKVFYCVTEDMTGYCEYEISGLYDLTVDYELEAVFEHCADDYWNNHDGCESVWPLTFTLHREENGPEIARASLDMEAEPRFYATRKQNV